MQWITESIQGLFGQFSADEAALQKTGELTKEQVLKFFEAGHRMFDDPMVKLKLKEAASKRQNVDGVITEMQKQIFESQGIEGRFGIGFLGKIRTVYGNDAEMMKELMKFVEHEELSLDEAELSIDDFLKKLELRDWALQQYQATQEQMRNLSPQQQRDMLHQQQLMMKEVTKETKDIAKKAESMSPEEKQAFVEQQVKSLQERFKLKQSSACGAPGPGCDHCTAAPAGPPPGQDPTLGSVMTPEEQANFFKALYKTGR